MPPGGPSNTTGVIDWAVWSARRLDVPLAFLQGLERHAERAAVSDYSGAIGLGAQDTLLQALSEADEQRRRWRPQRHRRRTPQRRSLEGCVATSPRRARVQDPERCADGWDGG